MPSLRMRSVTAARESFPFERLGGISLMSFLAMLKNAYHESYISTMTSYSSSNGSATFLVPNSTHKA